MVDGFFGCLLGNLVWKKQSYFESEVECSEEDIKFWVAIWLLDVKQFKDCCSLI